VDARLLLWRRLDVEGLERLEMTASDGGLDASSTVLCAADGGLRVDHRWRIDRDGRARSLVVERRGPSGGGTLRLERVGAGWSVDGRRRADLEGADEPDLSVTPFCNTLPIRRVPTSAGASLTIDTAWIDGATLEVLRSRQRYERLGARRFRYVDLGAALGFEAVIETDDEGWVLRYESLFERVAPLERGA